MLKTLNALFFAAVLSLSLSAHAVITAKCPAALAFEVTDITPFSKSFIYSIAAQRDYADYVSIDYILDGKLKPFRFAGILESTANSVCTYAAQKVGGTYISAKISGTDETASLNVFFSISEKEITYDLYANPTSKIPAYDFTGAEIQIKALGHDRVWDENMTRLIPVGKALFN